MDVDKVTAGLFIAAISALTFVAYQHPNAYKKMYPAFTLLGLLISTFAFGWSLGEFLTYRAVKEFIVVEKLKEAKAASDSYDIPNWVLGANVGTILYVVFLSFLPR